MLASWTILPSEEVRVARLGSVTPFGISLWLPILASRRKCSISAQVSLGLPAAGWSCAGVVGSHAHSATTENKTISGGLAFGQGMVSLLQKRNEGPRDMRNLLTLGSCVLTLPESRGPCPVRRCG